MACVEYPAPHALLNEYVMVYAPVEIPVTTPVPETDPTAGADDDQVPPAGVHVNVVVCPVQDVLLPVMAFTVGTKLIVAVTGVLVAVVQDPLMAAT